MGEKIKRRVIEGFNYNAPVQANTFERPERRTFQRRNSY